MICALISPAFSFISTSTGSLPSRICWRISGTHFGQSESVERGQPSGGFVFSYDFSSGFSDHLGVNPGFCLMRLTRSNTDHAARAPRVNTFSAYFTGLGIRSCSFDTLTSHSLLGPKHLGVDLGVLYGL